MSCSMIAAEMPLDRTTDVTVSMMGVFSRVLTPLVGSSRNRSFGRSAYAMATSRSLRSPCETPPASIRAFPSRRKSPEIRLTSVVLPAPLEPISASTSRSLTVKSTWSTAWVSPKYLTRFLVTSRLTSAHLLPARGEPARGADDPRGQREHERHQHGPEEELPVHRVADRVGLEVVEHDRPDDGAREGPEAAEHGREDDLAREAPEDDIG